MATKLTCVTIGDHITCVSSISKNKKLTRTLHQFACATPPESIQDGQITNPERISEALKPELRRHKINTRNLLFSVQSTKIAFREVILPAVKESRIQTIVEANAADYFPVDLEKYHVTQKKLEDVERDGQKRTRVMVYAAPLALLEPYFRLAELLGGKVAGIDSAGNSQFQALRELVYEDAKLFAYVDSMSVQMTFFREGKLLLQRSLPVGAFDFVRDYMQASGTPESELLPTLMRMSGDQAQNFIGQAMNADDVKESLSRLSSGIGRSIGYFNQSFWETPASSIIIGGPCSMVWGLVEAIAAETSLPTERFDQAVAGHAFAARWTGSCAFQNNIGASIAPLEMIPVMYQSKRKKREEAAKKPSLRMGVLVLLFCAVSSLALWYLANEDLEEAKEQNRNIAKQIEANEYAEGVYTQYLDYNGVMEALLEVRVLADSPNDKLADFIEELERNMPSDIIVLTMACTRQNVVINAQLNSKTSAAAMLAQLRAFTSLGDVSMPTITEIPDETGVSHVSFSVTCTYRS